MRDRIDFIVSEISRNQTYHNHKENMAWFATVLYVTGSLGAGWAIQGRDHWPWIAPTLVIWVVLTGLAAWFVCWQFNNRMIAANRVTKLIMMVKECLNTGDKEGCKAKLECYFDCIEKHKISSRDTQVISLLVMSVSFIAFLTMVCSR